MMSKAAPGLWTYAEVDIRDAARRAARRDGLSLGDWLDGVMAAKAEALGVAASELNSEECFDAVAERLGSIDDHRPAHFVTTDRALADFEASRSRARANRDAVPLPASATAPIKEPLSVATSDLGKRASAAWSAQTGLGPLPGATATIEGSEATRRGTRRRDLRDARIVRDNVEGVAQPPSNRSEPARLEPVSADALRSAATEAEAQRSVIEAKLNALFKALDRPSSRPDAVMPGFSIGPDEVVPEAASPAPSAIRAKAMATSFSLDQAISAISERQAFLDRSAPVRAPDAPSAAADPVVRPDTATQTLFDRYARALTPSDQSPKAANAKQAPRPAPEAEPKDHAPASGAPAKAEARLETGSASFASLQADIARMSSRLETMLQDVSHRDAAPPPKDPAFDEIRSMLGKMRPDQSIDALEQRVADLTAKIDQSIETQLHPDAIERLSQRIDNVQSSLSERIAASVPPAMDANAIEQAVRDVVGSITAVQHHAPDVRALEEMVRGLADKLDEAATSRSGVALYGELQAQVTKLAERIDRSDAGLSAIIAVERSMGELFAQMEETRDAAINAAEHAARTAARDTLRSAMEETGLAFAPAQRSGDAAVEQVTLEIADLRAARDVADKRLHGILGTLNLTLEKVVDRLGALEHEGQDTRAAAAPVVANPVNPLNAAHRSRPIPTVDPSAVVAPRPDRAPVVADGDFLIEPGAGPGRDRKVPVTPTVTAAPETDPSAFIVAARKAAQAAASDVATRAPNPAVGRVRGPTPAPSVNAPSAVERAIGYASARRRPLLLAVAGLVVLIGAVQVARLSLMPSTKVAVEDQDMGAPKSATQTASNDEPAPAQDNAAADTSAVPTITAPAAITATAPPAEAAPKPVPGKSLPTLAMGPEANLAAVKAAAPAGIGAGLRDMANDGSASAQFEIGLRLADGRGVPRDMKTASDWFEKAAKQGLAPAAYRLGSLYEKGLGVAKDPALSIKWYEKAAEQGNVRAMHNLAVMSAEGANGKSDYAKAASWFTKAAEAGVRDSQFNLAILYARGLGIEQNLPQSYMWFSVAAAQGDADAAKKRDEVGQRLDAKALADAKKAAESFQPLPTVAAANDVTPPPGGWDALPARGTPTSALKANGSAKVSSM